MPTQLEKIDFSEEHLSRVESFSCGEDVWCEHATKWINGTPPFNSALKSIAERGTSVWLYLVAGHVVGFSSLGTINWPWPLPDGPRRKVGYIPQMAMHEDFQGQPQEGPTFATQIMSDVLLTATRKGLSEVCLIVDSENDIAITFYKKCHFQEGGTYEQHGREFMRMFALLDESSETQPT